MLTDIEKDTVDFIPNYDDRLKEPNGAALSISRISS